MVPPTMGDPSRLLVKLRLTGPLVDDSRLPLSELERTAKLVRGTLRSIALVLSDQGPGRQGGRVKRYIETSVDLDVIGAPRSGSFCLEMEVARDAEADQPGLDLAVGPHLGERAVDALIEGVMALQDDTARLPQGFDRGVLQQLSGFARTLARGVEGVELTTSRHGKLHGFVCLDRARSEAVKKLISSPVISHASAEGTLRMVDDRGLEGRLERSPLPSVNCFFQEADRDAAWEAGQGRQLVRVVGEGEFLPGDPHPRRISVESMTVVSEVLPFDPEVFWTRRSLDDLAEEQDAQAFAPRPLDDEWRDDDEAAALIAAVSFDE